MLTVDDMSVWELAHRLNGEDPYRWHWWGLSWPVKDSARMLMNEILQAHLECSSLSLEKWHPHSEIPKEFFIRTYLDDVYACVWGKRFNRRLLKWASIDRWAFHRWCLQSGYPLPNFWFACQWTYPKDDEQDEEKAVQENVIQGADSGAISLDSGSQEIQKPSVTFGEEDEKWEDGLRPCQIAKIACRQVARNLWEENPDMTIANMIRHKVVRDYAGGGHYEERAVRGWINTVAPEAVRNRRGRPKKK